MANIALIVDKTTKMWRCVYQEEGGAQCSSNKGYQSTLEGSKK
jgi:hypothetical protein